MTIGDRIRIRREELRMSQQELALKMGFKDRSSVAKIETSGDKVTLKNIDKISKALCCSVTFLMGYEDEPAPVKEDLENFTPQVDYYVDAETTELAQTLKDNKELRILFDSAKDAKPEDLAVVYAMLLALKSKERND